MSGTYESAKPEFVFVAAVLTWFLSYISPRAWNYDSQRHLFARLIDYTSTWLEYVDRDEDSSKILNCNLKHF